MSLQFTTVSLAQTKAYYRCWESLPVHSIDYSLLNLWGWQNFFGLEWAFDGGMCWIRQTRSGKPIFWAPVGNWDTYPWEECLTPGMEFIRVPQALSNIWKTIPSLTVECSEDRGQWEYLYNANELATLPGNRFHKKKNHFNAYIRAYGTPDYRPLSTETLQDCRQLQSAWNDEHKITNSATIEGEDSAIDRVLDSYTCFNKLSGGCLYIKGLPSAFCIAEQLSENTVGIHFEKSLERIRGGYQAINTLFAQHTAPEITFINRAQDLDEPGLRQAKETYHPATFLRKDRICIA